MLDLIPSKESERKLTFKCGNIKVNNSDSHLKSLRSALLVESFKLSAQYICDRMDPDDVFEGVHKRVKDTEGLGGDQRRQWSW